ncbi:MAG TPA: hypothetical protein VMZ31_05290 [Phycisphaerae bacterium]|nr:hypothetical protein [Phycisphaerae bacterium]
MTLATHIRYAQALAVDRGRPSRLHVDLERQRYRVELARDFSGYDFVAAPGRAGQYTSLPARIEFGVVELSNGMSSSDVLLFAPSDQWTVGQIVLTNGEASATVKVERGLGCVNVVREITGKASSAD